MVNWQKHTRWCWWLTYEPTLFRTSIIHSKTIWLFFIIKQEIHEREEVKNNIDTPSMSSSYIEEPRPDSVTKPSKHHIAFISSSPLKSFKTATMHVSRELWQHGKSLYIFRIRERKRELLFSLSTLGRNIIKVHLDTFPESGQWLIRLLSYFYPILRPFASKNLRLLLSYGSFKNGILSKASSFHWMRIFFVFLSHQWIRTDKSCFFACYQRVKKNQQWNVLLSMLSKNTKQNLHDITSNLILHLHSQLRMLLNDFL